jgi:hypothetical protein
MNNEKCSTYDPRQAHEEAARKSWDADSEDQPVATDAPTLREIQEAMAEAPLGEIDRDVVDPEIKLSKRI